MATSRHVMLLVVACTLMVLFIGSAEACPNGYADCYHGHRNKCETNIWQNVNHCGRCHHRCPVTWGHYAYAYCNHGDCYQRCKYGYKYDDYKRRCVRKYHH